MEPDPACRHHWRIAPPGEGDPPEDLRHPATCRRCGAQSRIPGTFPRLAMQGRTTWEGPAPAPYYTRGVAW